MKHYKIEIASVPDKENLVAEIWYGEKMIAELSQESRGVLDLDLYSNGDKTTSLDYNDFIEALEIAKNRLLSTK